MPCQHQHLEMPSASYGAPRKLTQPVVMLGYTATYSPKPGTVSGRYLTFHSDNVHPLDGVQGRQAGVH